ncbi:hypothetical protein POPTR_001G422966v4 [Populus trichocarpa]|uniref:Uncharacterized protein n=1 Tax=Populus trichocarpa TaxID=3694 RepID=A0ACC0TPT6_POPTR|nr:hypothetical protein POPTR_001G422966v4 [Populus trichocarpa]
MSEANQGNNPDASAIVPLKRRRGRPRKYPKMEVDHVANAHVNVPGIQNLNHGENAHAPPGFGVVNSNQPHQVGPVNNAIDAMIGQSVYGVIEATFDAGYLLNVRVGDTETTLRGVVFKPGHYIPVNPENDIAPDVPMIRRNEIPLTRESNNQVLSVVPQTPPISRGNVVPVVLQPVNLSNGALSASATNQTAHLVPSKGKQVLDAAPSSNGLTPTNEIIQFQSQNNHQVITSPFNQNPAGGLHESEVSPMKTTHMPFEKLLTEVIRRVHAPSQSTETNSSLAVNLPVEDSGIVEKKDGSDTEQALSVKPLQVLQPIVDSHPAVASIPSEDYKTGKMTQLLQENMTF